MSDINTTVLSGRLTRDPESRGNGSVSAMTVASNRQYQKDGAWVEEVVFADVTCFGHMAKKANEKLLKGAPVIVHGRLELNRWQAEDGSNRSQLRIIANQLVSPVFQGKKSDEATTEEPTEAKEQETTAASDKALAAEDAATFGQPTQDEDGIPF